jgi:membrane-bound lytic murein transglycosylase B
MHSKLLILPLLCVGLYGSYTNCEFKNPHYTDVCKNAIKAGVSYEYANLFLTSYFKTKKYDLKSWELLQPSKISYHKTQEKKANNALVRYLPKMVEHLKEYAEVYDEAEKRYGVNREIIAAILLKETHLGKIVPKHDAFIVFNTIVTHVKGDSPRERWLLNMGKTNMANIIAHCFKRDLQPEECNLPASYAGAVGIPQFMPNSFVYADAYRAEEPDLTKMEDAILSAAHYLHKRAAFSELIEWEQTGDVVAFEQEWYEYAFTHDNASFAHEKNKNAKPYSCFSKDRPELAYLKEQVLKVMRYNNSSNYAIGVISLAYQAHLLLQNQKGI